PMPHGLAQGVAQSLPRLRLPNAHAPWGAARSHTAAPKRANASTRRFIAPPPHGIEVGKPPRPFGDSARVPRRVGKSWRDPTRLPKLPNVARRPTNYEIQTGQATETARSG